MKKICQKCNQENKSNYNNFCRKCYASEYFKKMDPKNCKICNKLFKNMGSNCYSCSKKIRLEKNGEVFCVGCNRSTVRIENQTLKLCNTCYRHKREKEDPAWNEERLKKNMMWHRKYRGTDLNAPKRIRTGSWKVKQGYVLLSRPNHPNAKGNGSIFEHTFVMSEHIGRTLLKKETVHHKNGVRDDNRIENLELWSSSHPSGQRVEDKIKWAKEFLETYGFEVYEKKD